MDKTKLCYSIFLIDELRDALEDSYSICRRHQLEKQLVATEGTCHHILPLHPSYLILPDDISKQTILEKYFMGKFILNSFGGVVNFQNKSSYVGKIHRDQRSFSGSNHLMANVLIALDDFTLENGATRFLSRSHLNQIRCLDYELTAKPSSIPLCFFGASFKGIETPFSKK